MLFENNPSAIASSFSPPVGAQANIRSFTGENLTLDDGTDLGSSFAHVPVGYPGVVAAGDGGRAFLATAGIYNLELPNDANGTLGDLVHTPTRSSVSLRVRHDLSDRLLGFLDFSTYRNEGDFFRSSVQSAFFLDANAPNNPFQQSISVSSLVSGVDHGPSGSESETMQITVGVLAELAENWTAGVDLGWSEGTFESWNSFNILTSEFFAGQFSGSNPELDVLRDQNQFPIDYSPFRNTAPTGRFGPRDTELRTAALRLAGPLFEFRQRPVSMSVLYEYRSEEIADTFSDRIAPSGEVTVTYVPARKQVVDSLYAEMQMPLVARDDGIPGVYALDVQMALRRDEYETTTLAEFDLFDVPSRQGPFPDIGNRTTDLASTDFTVGFQWALVQDLRLRASFGTGFLPPALGQISPGFSETNRPLSAEDPKRGNERPTSPPGEVIELITGGNPDLGPEQSESLSIGIVLEPRVIDGLRLSADSPRIEKDDEIAVIGLQAFFDLEDEFPDRIVRGPLEPDAPAGFTAGPVLSVDSSRINIARTNVEAYDFRIDYRRDTDFGAFDVYALFTYQAEFERQTLLTQPIDSTPGFSNGPLEWRGNAGINWTNGPWVLGWNTQYFDSYLVYTSTASESSIESRVRNQGSARIASQTYHDAFLRYDFAASAWSDNSVLENAEVFVSIRNVFDKSPPILASAFPFGGYSTYGDPYLRSFLVTLRKAF